MAPPVKAPPTIVHSAARFCSAKNRLVNPGYFGASHVIAASNTIAATKKAEAALVNQASAAAAPATSPQIGRREASAYAAHATTRNIVIVDSISAARFHMTHVYSVARSRPPTIATRCPATAERPAMSAT